MVKVCFAELSFDALPRSVVSDLFERVEHEGPDGDKLVTFVYDDFDCPCKSLDRGGTFEVFEEYFRNEVEGKFADEILRLERLGSFPRLSFSLASGETACSQTEVSREMVCGLAERGMKLAMSFASMSRDEATRIEIPASLIRFLAGYNFAIAF